jgi:hypothetical protein
LKRACRMRPSEAQSGDASIRVIPIWLNSTRGAKRPFFKPIEEVDLEAGMPIPSPRNRQGRAMIDEQE